MAEIILKFKEEMKTIITGMIDCMFTIIISIVYRNID